MSPMSTPGAPQQQGDGDPRRWAPFPVQDWSTMPVTEPYAYVDPDWGPPASTGEPAQRTGSGSTDRRSGWLPLAASIMVTVLVAGGLFVATRAGGSAAGTAAATYLPADGSARYLQQQTSIGDQSTTSSHVAESARQTGALVLGGLDFTLGSKVLGSVGGIDHLDRMQFWRTTSTMIGNLGNSQQHLRVYRVDGPVELVAESSQSGADVYSPALLELPAHVGVGDSWSSEGSVGSRRYRSDLRAGPAEPGCLRVNGTIVESTTAGQAISTRTVSRTWCEHRGVTVEETVRGDVVTRLEAGIRPAADPTLRTVAEDWVWSDPAGWRRRDFDLLSADQSLGTGPMTGAPAQVAPVITASGLIFRTTNGDDIVATTPKTVDRWTSLWRMHPGGTVLSVAAFGDVVVATTSGREVVAYSDAGVRLWSLRLEDVAFWSPVRIDDRRVAVADAAGSVLAVDLLTGAESWRTSVGAQVSGPVVANSDTVVVFDAGGAATALDAGTGKERWSADLPAERAALLGDIVVVRNAATLQALDLRTGRHRWLLAQTGTMDDLQPFGDTVVAATQLGTVVVDEQGTVVQRLPAYERLTVVGDTIVGWGPKTAEFRDQEWRVRATIDTPDVDLVRSLPATLAYRQGVLVFGRNWTFSSWSDEP